MTRQKTRTTTVTVERTLTQVEKECPVCHTRYWGATNSRYCARACKNKADYQRHNEARRQERREKYQSQTSR